MTDTSLSKGISNRRTGKGPAFPAPAPEPPRKNPKPRHALTFWTLFLCFLLCPVPLVSQVLPYPPPAGKVWIRANGSWTMVPAPPNEGPFRWTRRGWERILAIPPGKKWVAPHWEKNRWVTGHWKIMRSKDPSRQWISGHWLQNGLWQTGFWKRIHPPPSSGIEGTWIPYTDGRPLRPHVPRKR